MSTLTTLDRVKLQLQIPAGITVADAILNTLIDEACDQILRQIGLPAGISTATYAEIYDIDNRDQERLRLRRFPVRSIVALTCNGSAWSVSGANEEVYIDRADAGWIRTKQTYKWFPRGKQTVEITYTAGYDSVPGGISSAATALVVHGYNTGGTLGLKSERIGSYSYDRASSAIADTSSWPAAVWSGLHMFRRVVPQMSGVRDA